MKIKIYFNFFSSFVIGTGRVNNHFVILYTKTDVANYWVHHQGFIQALSLTSVFHEGLSVVAIGHNPTYVSMFALAAGGSYTAL